MASALNITKILQGTPTQGVDKMKKIKLNITKILQGTPTGILTNSFCLR